MLSFDFDDLCSRSGNIMQLHPENIYTLRGMHVKGHSVRASKIGKAVKYY